MPDATNAPSAPADRPAPSGSAFTTRREFRAAARSEAPPSASDQGAATNAASEEPAATAADRPSKRDVRRMERAARRAGKGRVSPARGIAGTVAVGALLAGVAVPAFGTALDNPVEATAAAHAATKGQSLVVASEASAPDLDGASYGATTPEEIEQKQAEKAAVAAAAAAAAAQPGADPASFAPIATSGQVIYPMAAGGYSIGEGFGAPRPGRIHEGQDFVAGVGAPIYAAADGVVTVSQESYGGFGVSVVLESQIGGQTITTTYSHMNWGSRAVQVGQTVQAGQYLGEVGSTGFVVGSCLHFEVRVNGGLVNPLPWLEANVT